MYRGHIISVVFLLKKKCINQCNHKEAIDKCKSKDIVRMILPVLFKKSRSRKAKNTEKLFQVKGN